MTDSKTSLFFCGIGGSGMLPLAVIAQGLGMDVTGSDRSHDAGRSPLKFSVLERQGIHLVPQDGLGLTDDYAALIVSAAIEDTIPEVVRARELGIPIKKRAALLAELFNAAKYRIGVAGTSGKSTTTAMIGWCLHYLGLDPTMMNGAPLSNLVTHDNPYASALVGDAGLFVSECDESDGSVVLYTSDIAVLTNISLDHMELEKLHDVFRSYLENAQQQVVNLDSPLLVDLLGAMDSVPVTFGLTNPDARFTAQHIDLTSAGIDCIILDRLIGAYVPLHLQLMGRHNIENALACLAVLTLMNIPLEKAAEALGSFTGVKRRLEIVGTAKGVTVIDDFGHNPEKIAATLRTLHDFSGRLLVMFQIHGYGPLRLMKDELLAMFVREMKPGDQLFLPDVLYQGGTTDKSYGAAEFCRDLQKAGVTCLWQPTRDAIGQSLLDAARDGDRIVIMGARDDTLSDFAQGLLQKLK
ncbi:MAG: Mur ligase family protein [Pseudobdellovibrionaceae bacterium]